jgi:hypothetical protein
MISGLIEDAFRSREELPAENLLLRQQLLVASRKVKQAKSYPWERGLLVVLASRLHGWREATLLVKPDTVLRWHREGFRLFWKRKSKSGRVPKSRLPQETIDLIIRLSNSVVERFLGGVRRECLDHVVILGEAHLRSVLTTHAAYFNSHCPHQGIQQRIPRAKESLTSGSTGNVVAFPVLSGLHHHYQRVA